MIGNPPARPPAATIYFHLPAQKPRPAANSQRKNGWITTNHSLQALRSTDADGSRPAPWAGSDFVFLTQPEPLRPRSPA
jgi:hypothetical protein